MSLESPSSSPSSTPAPTILIDSGVAASSATRKRSLIRRIIKALAYVVASLVALCLMLWAALAIFYSDLSTRPPRTLCAILYVLASLAVLILIRRRWRWIGRLAFVLLWVGVLFWFLNIEPRNDRDWLPDVARAPTIEINPIANRMTVHNVRNFDYRSETDYTPRWEDRTYDLDQLRGCDIILVYWGSKAIAHGMVTFDFGNNQYLCCSIETRKEKGETYSALQGFFRQYELVYIFADERDLVRLRTNFRHEDVYLYRTNFTPGETRKLLMAYVNRANELAVHPEFYNALTSNCVTNIIYSGRAINPNARITWRTILSGYAAEGAYNRHRIDTRIPFKELEQKSHINDVAVALPNDENFSKSIRIDLPTPIGWKE